MSSSFEKSVKGGTKVKLAPPKSKYVEHILLATQSGEAGVAEVFRTLIHRLRDSTWTVVFKSLIIIHLMIKEGAPEVTLRYLAVNARNRLAINGFTDVQTQGANIRHYSEYLLARSVAYASTKTDHARNGDARVKRLTVDKGLLRETELVQDEIKALVKCNLLSTEPENEISLTAFRLLTRDLLDLYNVENEAVMNVLSHYFEMSKPDAERAIRIYKAFCKQTDQVVQFLSVARQYEHATRLEIPKIKHAPTSLAQSLQEYLDDKDFDINRRQYLAEQEARKSGKTPSKTSLPQAASKSTRPATSSAANTPTNAQAPANSFATAPSKGPAPDLIDFFESIEQNQQPLPQSTFPQHQQQQQLPQPFFAGNPNEMFAPQQQPFATGYQATNQPLPMNNFPSGVYEAPPVQQNFMMGNAFAQQQQLQQPQQPLAQQAPLLQPQHTSSNPFRQSMMPTGGTIGSPGFGAVQRQSTNPFAKEVSPAANSPTNNFQPSPPQLLQPQVTGTNPFARPVSQHVPAQTLQVQPTGGTNPFRQSQFINQQTGQGWQNAPQGTMGGLETLDTIPIFPRPGQTQSPQSHASPWV